jgi:mannose-6-phosphate isomerase-like protein (cupin superfamily)
MDPSKPATAVVALREALAMGPPPPGNLALPVYGHGTLQAELYAPVGQDRQKPHDRDEIYVVVRGRGVFYDGEVRTRVEPGAFIFAAAGRAHRFENFTTDFATWVFFYGPPGGENRASSGERAATADASPG